MEDNKDRLLENINVEWLKNKLAVVCSLSKFCGICLNNTRNLNSLNMEFIINKHKESKCLVDVMNYVFNDDVENIISSTFICDMCTEKTIQSYIFIHNTKKISKIISDCVTDIDGKLLDLSEQVFETIYDSNASVVLVLENNEKLYKEIEDITDVTEVTPKDIDMELTETELIPIIITDGDKDVTYPEYTAVKVHTDVAENDLVKNAIPIGEYIPNINATDSLRNISFDKGQIIVKPLKTMSSPRNSSYSIYKCNHCPHIFTNYRTLKEHEKANHKFQIYKCSLCDKTYNTRQYLNLHYKSHSMSRCKICCILINDDILYTHLKEAHAQIVHPCKFCDIVYYTEEALDTHFKVSHLINNKNLNSHCIMCLKDINKDELKTHTCKFSCPECHIMPCIHYEYLIAYREQTLQHVSKVKCIDCDYVTARKTYLVAHVNREHLDHHPFTCNDCGMQFYTKMSLKNHIDLYHVDIACEYCDTEFKKQSLLKEHRKECKTVIRTINCNKCVASFDHEDEYTKHELLRHNDAGYPCTFCKRRFLEERQLKEHQVTAHNTVQFKNRRKNIECSLCEIKFNNLKELQMHEKSHLPGTVYPCKSCKKEFYSLKKLYVHQTRHYERTTCNVCKKRIISVFTHDMQYDALTGIPLRFIFASRVANHSIRKNY